MFMCGSTTVAHVVRLEAMAVLDSRHADLQQALLRA